MTYIIILTILMYSCIIVVVVVATSNAPKFSSILVFGDSTVDTGNNNDLIFSVSKANHEPYGRDFPGQVPTGRFSNGKLIPDFIASYLNIKDTVPAYKDPNLSNDELLTGVNFASGGAGFDDFSSFFSHSIPVSHQIDQYFREYVEKIKEIAGEDKAKQILGDALVIISAGSNDVIINFYNLPTRRLAFNISGYQDFLQNNLQTYIQQLYDLGCRRIAVAGLPPIGFIPLQILLKFPHMNDENSDSKDYNQKLEKRLLEMQAMLPGSKVVYAEIYDPLFDLISQPEKYGFTETKIGCCGNGIVLGAAAITCNKATPICEDASKFVFWDCVHPTETTYHYLAKYLEMEVLPKF
ncbi:hypothetical protein TanjilG_32151 [Lupinus angustifolius]|uniref:GDSL esterase/lipase n=1 Tax=Lupinus angustifolius TaxID=3871 RepID=A0A1J7HUI3_LUPAN|nr:PREDICTED: GDSL esterase/lipase At2g30310-like [Lupinus angustifolius]OIW16481.1 hypothetical protein TanjilG_32151 [Lupinus angustifolius]